MLKKVFFKCNLCEFAHEDYMDPNKMESQMYPFNLGEGKHICPKCKKGSLLYDENYKPDYGVKGDNKIYTSTIDNRKLNPGKYQDSKFKAKMAQINRHKDIANGIISK